MNEDNQNPMTDHDYDGIRELDNPLPTWWLVTFFITIIFGFHYWLHYSIAGGQTQMEELKVSLKSLETQQKKVEGAPETADELNALAASPDIKNKGQAVYAAKCAVCHGQDLQGLIGPNLTDDYWIHGKGSLTDIISVVRKGVGDKGMPTWEGILPKADLQAVVVFVHSRRGTHPPNPKAPQGDPVAN